MIAALRLVRSALGALSLLAVASSALAEEGGAPPSEPDARYPSHASPRALPDVQVRSHGRGYVSLDLLSGMPFEGARGGGGGWAWGFGFKVAGGYRDWPVMLGGDFQFSYFGTVRGQERFIQDGMEMTRILRHRDRVIFLNAFLRLQPTTWRIRPYVEGVAGVKFIESQYTVDAVFASGDDVAASAGTHAPTLGVGAGIEFPLRKNDGEPVGTRLTASARWLHGGDVAFDKTISRGGEGAVVRSSFSTTTTLFMVGIAADFLPRARTE